MIVPDLKRDPAVYTASITQPDGHTESLSTLDPTVLTAWLQTQAERVGRIAAVITIPNDVMALPSAPNKATYTTYPCETRSQ